MKNDPTDKKVSMKKLIAILFIVAFLTGCAASTLSMKGADGSSMVLENYVVTEVYSPEGKLTKRTMIPAKSMIEGALDKLAAAWKSISLLTDPASILPAIK